MGKDFTGVRVVGGMVVRDFNLGVGSPMSTTVYKHLEIASSVFGSFIFTSIV